MTRPRETKWDKDDPGRQGQVSHADKVAIAAYYEAEMAKERTSASVLQELSDRYKRSQRQIQRYIQDFRESPSIDANQAELSGHWPSLREFARSLSAGFYVPLPQVLEMPWKLGTEFNGAWTMDRSAGIEGVHLYAEVNPLFDSLAEHLPGDPFWEHLIDWKESLVAVSHALHNMVDQVVYRLVIRQDVELTTWLPISAVLEATEVFDVIPTYTFKLEATGDGRYILRRYRNSTEWVDLAIANEPPVFEGLEEEFSRLVAEVSASPKFFETQEQFGNLHGAGRAVVSSLEHISLMAAFPGRCSLCP